MFRATRRRLIPIDIKHIDKAALLAGLFNRSKPQGLGFLAQGHNNEMTVDDARKVLKTRGETDFDYLQGRVMKVDLSGDKFESILYDRDNGEGAALEVVNALRAESKVHFRTGVPANRTEKLAATPGKAQEAVDSADIQIITLSMRK